MKHRQSQGCTLRCYSRHSSLWSKLPLLVSKKQGSCLISILGPFLSAATSHSAGISHHSWILTELLRSRGPHAWVAALLCNKIKSNRHLRIFCKGLSAYIQMLSAQRYKYSTVWSLPSWSRETPLVTGWPSSWSKLTNQDWPRYQNSFCPARTWHSWTKKFVNLRSRSGTSRWSRPVSRPVCKGQSLLIQVKMHRLWGRTQI